MGFTVHTGDCLYELKRKRYLKTQKSQIIKEQVGVFDYTKLITFLH